MFLDPRILKHTVWGTQGGATPTQTLVSMVSDGDEVWAQGQTTRHYDRNMRQVWRGGCWEQQREP